MKVEKINKTYGNTKVVKDVSLQIPPNSITSFIGPNGAGKSTVLNMLTRLTNIDLGDVKLDEISLGDWCNNSLAKELAIMTQSHELNVKLTIRELVSFGRFPYSKSNLTLEDDMKINEAVSYMELHDIADKYLDEVSGGQRQRAYIAMVIAQDTKFIFLDEPTNNLDIYHSSQMMKLVRKMCDDFGKTIIMVLHEINFASVYSDYIAAFLDGELFKFGTVEEVMTKENLKALYNVDFTIQYVNGKPISLYY